jgi:two-component system, OmpR family, flagellar system response regulator FtcR
MIVIVDERPAVVDAFVVLLEREGVAATGLCSSEFNSWITAVSAGDVSAVEAFLVGDCVDRPRVCRVISSHSRAVIVAMSEARSLEETLELFAAGVDDVVRKPVHVKEILARVSAAGRRVKSKPECIDFGDLHIFFDGRDLEIGRETFLLPRRELRILTYLASNIGCRVSKTQIFNAVYGLFNDEVDESVIESHISKLRKRLRSRLGYDPIESKRFLGYRLIGPDEIDASLSDVAACIRPAQDEQRLIVRTPQLVQD